MAATDDPMRDFADRAFRQALAEPRNLRAFLRRAVPHLADGFDYDRLQVLDRELPYDDWRDRECDLLVEMPYRAEAVSEPVLVCVLVEHQSRSDWRMPLRTLVYTVLHWDRQLKDWEQRTGDKPAFRLTPVIPIVLYAAPRPWGSARTLADLIDAPEAIRVFSPRWEPLFWELAATPAGELQASREAFDQFLAVVRAETGPADEMQAAFDAAYRLVQESGADRVYVFDMLRVILYWALARRPADERQRWQQVAEAATADAEAKREVKVMGQTILEYEYTRGLERGRIEAARELIRDAAQERLGQPAPDQAEALGQIDDLARLKAIHRRLSTASTWAELLGD